VEKILEQMHAAMGKELLRRIEDGTATASDLSVARQFLKDNGIDSVPTESSPIGQLTKAMPFDDCDQTVAH